jgi:hypothetical protein
MSVRLPTEAEWEYACRAGTTTPFNTGDTIKAGLANYNGNEKKTTAVGSFNPNSFGLYDMHGNVWQWCSDWYYAYEDGKKVDPQGPQGGEHRVLRGGSWDVSPWNCRSAARYELEPFSRDRVVGKVGFRVAASPNSPRAQSADSANTVSFEYFEGMVGTKPLPPNKSSLTSLQREEEDNLYTKKLQEWKDKLGSFKGKPISWNCEVNDASADSNAIVLTTVKRDGIGVLAYYPIEERQNILKIKQGATITVSGIVVDVLLGNDIIVRVSCIKVR